MQQFETLDQEAGLGAVVLHEMSISGKGRQNSASRLAVSPRTETLSKVMSSNDPVSTRRGLRRSTSSLEGRRCSRHGMREGGRQTMFVTASSPSWHGSPLKHVVELIVVAACVRVSINLCSVRTRRDQVQNDLETVTY